MRKFACPPLNSTIKRETKTKTSQKCTMHCTPSASIGTNFWALQLVGNTVANQYMYFITGDDKCEFGLVWWKSKSKKCNSICKKTHNNYSQHISLQNPREKEEDASIVMFALSSRASRPSSQRTRWALRGRY